MNLQWNQWGCSCGKELVEWQMDILFNFLNEVEEFENSRDSEDNFSRKL